MVTISSQWPRRHRRIARSGLRKQLLTFAFAAVVPGFGVLGWYLFSAWDHALEIAQLNSKVTAAEVGRDLWGVLRDFREVGAEIASRPQVRSLDRIQCEPAVREYSSIHKEVAALTLRDLHGGLICSSVLNAAAKLPDSQLYLIEEARNSTMGVISNVERGPSSDKWVLAIVSPVRDDTMTIRAVLILTLDLREYSERLFAGIPAGTVVTAIDRNQKIAMSSQNQAEVIGTISGDKFALTFADQSGFMRMRDANDTPYLGAYVVEPLSGWRIISMISEDTILAPQRRQLIWVAAGSAVLFLLFCLALVRTLDGIARPLLALANVAKEVSQGNMQARAGEAGAPEISRVATQMNVMLDVIDRQRQETNEAGIRITAIAERLIRVEGLGAVGGLEHDLTTGAFTLTPGSCRILEIDAPDAPNTQEYLRSSRFMTPQLKSIWEGAILQPEAWDADVLVETAKGHACWLHIRGEVEVRNGHPTKVVSHIRDFTELKAAQDRLRQSEKMQAFGELAGGIAHDFNNIVGAMRAFADLLVSDLSPGSEPWRFANRIVASCRRATALVQEIMAFSHVKNTERAPVAVADLLRDSRDILHSRPEKTLELLIVDETGGATINANESQMSQVLSNLVINAADAIDTTGPIRLSTEIVEADPALVAEFSRAERRPFRLADDWLVVTCGNLRLEQSYARFMVVDKGVGMSEAVLAQIFAPFFTTKGKSRGTGLGLPVVVGIVESHQGAIRVLTKAQCGTTFEVYIPTLERYEISAYRSAPAPVADLRGHERVLIVDDEADVAEGLAIALGRLGYETAPVYCPLEALEIFAEDPRAWDLVISDQNMPQLEGVELLRKMKVAQPGLRTIICTGSNYPLDAERRDQEGIDISFIKPVTADTLARSIRGLFR